MIQSDRQSAIFIFPVSFFTIYTWIHSTRWTHNARQDLSRMSIFRRITTKCLDNVIMFNGPYLGSLGLWSSQTNIYKSTSIKKSNDVYTELSVVSITPTTIRSSAMRCHSLSTWGFEDTAGVSSILSSKASSFDSSASSQSHRAMRPSWKRKCKDCNQRWQACDSIDSKNSSCQTIQFAH